MTKIIGILNLTLDSFSDGGKYYDLNSAKKHISDMIEYGADVIDIGAESTRSGFTDVDEDIQIKTLTPVIEYIEEHFDIELSNGLSFDTQDYIEVTFDYDKTNLDYDPRETRVVYDNFQINQNLFGPIYSDK